MPTNHLILILLAVIGALGAGFGAGIGAVMLGRLGPELRGQAGQPSPRSHDDGPPDRI